MFEKRERLRGNFIDCNSSMLAFFGQPLGKYHLPFLIQQRFLHLFLGLGKLLGTWLPPLLEGQDKILAPQVDGIGRIRTRVC